MGTVDTTRGQVEIKTARGKFTVGPHGQISNGLWRIVGRELRTNQQVRKICGGCTRTTLLRWRAKDFPAPVLALDLGGPNGKVELWSRSEVEAWWANKQS